MSQLTALEYNSIAHAALAYYSIEVARLDFIQYNGGITFRVDSVQGDSALGPSSFLLKIHSPLGSGISPSPNVIRSRHSWLRSLGQTSGLDLQMPIPNQQGDLLTLVADATSEIPYPCTLQKWVEGTPFSGHLTSNQIRQIGTMMAQFHHFSSEWSALTTVANDLPVYELSKLTQAVQTLALAVELGFLTEDDFGLINAAEPVIADIVDRVGRQQEGWGPIHSDFHHGNLLFYQEEIRLIDFDCLYRGPYAYDIGITLYHIHYQGPTLYCALLEGYEAVRSLPVDRKEWLEAFVTLAAIDNLAFNVTIPEQYTLPYLPRNLRQLVDEFCISLVSNTRFLLL